MKFFTLLALSTLTLSASAWSATCQVNMVNRFGNVLQSFYDNDLDVERCYNAQKECSKAIRLQNKVGEYSCQKVTLRPAPVPVPPRPGTVRPVPRPVPAPKPIPHPGPVVVRPGRPVPAPMPQYMKFELSDLIFDLVQTVSYADIKYSMMKKLLIEFNSPVATQINLCENEWHLNNQLDCLTRAVNIGLRQFVFDDQVARNIVSKTCQLAWIDRETKECYEAALQKHRFDYLYLQSELCRQMAYSDSAVSCYKEVFESRF